jgi:hypothetical protein
MGLALHGPAWAGGPHTHTPTKAKLHILTDESIVVILLRIQIRPFQILDHSTRDLSSKLSFVQKNLKLDHDHQNFY